MTKKRVRKRKPVKAVTDASPQEVIARALCEIAELTSDDEGEHGTPNWHEMRAQAVTIRTALANADFEIIQRDENPSGESALKARVEELETQLAELRTASMRVVNSAKLRPGFVNVLADQDAVEALCKLCGLKMQVMP